jgi:urate oxidase
MAGIRLKFFQETPSSIPQIRYLPTQIMVQTTLNIFPANCHITYTTQNENTWNYMVRVILHGTGNIIW